jgi:hypothetical protein
MKGIVFNALRDELRFRLSLRRALRTRTIGRFTLRFTEEGEICELDIRPFHEEQQEFRASLERVQLGGRWKGVQFTDADISEARKEIWRKIEGDA